MKNYVLKKWYKHSNHRKFEYPDDVDEELVPMLDVFNNLPGVRTIYCCCGHGDSQWYMVFRCASHFMANVIMNYFTKYVKPNEDEDWLKGVQTKFDYEVEYEDNVKYNTIPEEKVVVRSDALGNSKENERKAEYARICEFFASFMPMYEWKKVHQF
jgi:hypothetical protein